MTLFVELKLVTRTKKTASLRKLDVMSISSKATSNFPAISRYMLELRSLRRLSQPTLVILKSPSYTLLTAKRYSEFSLQKRIFFSLWKEFQTDWIFCAFPFFLFYSPAQEGKDSSKTFSMDVSGIRLKFEVSFDTISWVMGWLLTVVERISRDRPSL